MENFIDGGIEEKRRSKRVNSSLPIQFKNLKTPDQFFAASIIKNISEGGACFKSSKFVSLACRFVVEIALPNTPKPIKAISKVAWIRKVPATDQYELGNQFLEITKEDKANIKSFVDQDIPQTT